MARSSPAQVTTSTSTSTSAASIPPSSPMSAPSSSAPRPMPPMLWYREATAIAFLLLLCSSYYVIPLLILLAPIGAAVGSPLCLHLLLLMIGLALAPTFTWRSFRRGWVMSCVLEYFAFRWVHSKDIRSSFTDPHDADDPYDASRRYLAVWMPHGIVPVGPLCGGVYLEQHWPQLYGKMAVAPSVLRLPFLRQLLGVFEIQSAAYGAIQRSLRTSNVSLMPGGLAELYLCDKEVERVYLQRRKGFCKLALSVGADVSPIYLFGATLCFDFIKPHPESLLARLCRRVSVSLLLFYGRWGLPIPYRVPITLVAGKSLRCTRTDEPTREQVNELHGRVVAAVEKLYLDHREEAGPEWAHKQLVIH